MYYPLTFVILRIGYSTRSIHFILFQNTVGPDRHTDKQNKTKKTEKICVIDNATLVVKLIYCLFIPYLVRGVSTLCGDLWGSILSERGKIYFTN